MAKHEFTRIRQEVVRRTLQVTEKQQLTPDMLRIVFRSDDLQGFNSPSADDHVKIFLPGGDGAAHAARDFTPRAWDLANQTLTLDFALHPRGPAVDWARSAAVGDRVEIGGPKGSLIVPEDFDWYLLIGDATALPSIARRSDELPSTADVHVIALVAGPAEVPYLAGAQNRQITWIHSTRRAEDDRAMVQDALGRIEGLGGEGFIWIAAEVSVARAAYRYATETLRHPKEWIKAAGYWSEERAEGGERIA